MQQAGEDSIAVDAGPALARGWLPSWLDGRVLGWASCDVATSVYMGVVPTVLFPIFYVTSVDIGERRLLWWGAAVSLAMLVAGLLAPHLGRLADRSGRRWELLAICLLTSSAATILLGLPGARHSVTALALFAIAQCAYCLAQPLYESYLPMISTEETCGRVSGFGWASGFIGGIVVILVLLPIVGSAPAAPPFGTAFLVTGAIFLAFSVISLLLMRLFVDPAPTLHRVERHPVVQTLRDWRSHRDLFEIILSFYLVNIALVTISVFAAQYFNARFGASLFELLLLMLTYTVIALPSTMLFGVLADRTSHGIAISVSLGIWICAVALMAFGDAPWVPMVVVVVLGLVFGSTLSLFRSLIARLVPQGREAEFFGLNMAAGRVSAAVGPLLYGAVVTVTASPRLALSSMIVFVFAGLAVLARVSKRSRMSWASATAP